MKCNPKARIKSLSFSLILGNLFLYDFSSVSLFFCNNVDEREEAGCPTTTNYGSGLCSRHPASWEPSLCNIGSSRRDYPRSGNNGSPSTTVRYTSNTTGNHTSSHRSHFSMSLSHLSSHVVTPAPHSSSLCDWLCDWFLFFWLISLCDWFLFVCVLILL